MYWLKPMLHAIHKWNPQIRDTLGPVILSFTKRLSCSRGLKMIYTVLLLAWCPEECCREIIPFSEGPLSKVPLHYSRIIDLHTTCTDHHASGKCMHWLCLMPAPRMRRLRLMPAPCMRWLHLPASYPCAGQWRI